MSMYFIREKKVLPHRLDFVAFWSSNLSSVLQTWSPTDNGGGNLGRRIENKEDEGGERGRGDGGAADSAEARYSSLTSPPRYSGKPFIFASSIWRKPSPRQRRRAASRRCSWWSTLFPMRTLADEWKVAGAAVLFHHMLVSVRKLSSISTAL